MSGLRGTPMHFVNTYKARFRKKLSKRLKMADVTEPNTEAINWYFFASKKCPSPKEAASVRLVSDELIAISPDEDRMLNVSDIFYSYRTMAGTLLVARSRWGQLEFYEGNGVDFNVMTHRDIRIPRMAVKFDRVLQEIHEATRL